MPVSWKPTDTSGAGIKHIALYVDGLVAAEADADTISTCLKVPPSPNVQILAVAQTNTGSGGLARFPPKGWAEIHVTGQATGASTCSAGGDDTVDGGADGGGGESGGGGCSCRAAGERSSGSGLAAVVVALGAILSRRSSRRSSSRRRG